jgi:5-formyltetrahydrofolate cyclo-ligase
VIPAGGATDRFDVSDAKRALRARMRAIRRSIASEPSRHRARSEAIGDAVIALMTARSALLRRVMTYDPLPGEVDLARVHEWCRSNGIDRFVPEVRADAPDELRVVPGDLDPAALDVVVVPGLAYTADGHRLGQGGGHFDRFLPRLAPSCVSIGVCFAEQLVDAVPVEPHDVTVDHVVSDAPSGER